MSIHSSRSQPLEVRDQAVCMCVHGQSCSVFAPGHAVHLIQARLASATPLEWADAIVTDADAAAGTLTVHTVTDGESLQVWSGAGAAHVAPAGTPVAVHRRYHVLAVGTRWFNIAALDTDAA
ncbi:hypothetical protein [Microbacterium sp. zg-YB36]|uniref:hypothetical protein n=1 Tax=Microbacterium sp. zg-YB36 TaxID=2969407 RepID=UPI00214CEBD7|nr:hypothetical protein [Microbacterium sp. zg-YB36]MDL5349979.1 hypothetical protein [Microbacterium sp. zg-YB36]